MTVARRTRLLSQHLAPLLIQSQKRRKTVKTGKENEETKEDATASSLSPSASLTTTNDSLAKEAAAPNAAFASASDATADDVLQAF